jgi:hypothetical protein
MLSGIYTWSFSFPGGKVEILVIGVCVVFLLGYISLMTLLFVVMRREGQAARGVVLAKDGDEFWTRFHGFIRSCCSRGISMLEARPLVEHEDASYFHHLYLPLREYVVEKNSASYRKQLWQVALITSCALAMTLMFYPLTGEGLFLYLAVPFSMLLVFGVITFLWLPRLGERQVSSLREVDEKLIGMGHGTEPPPYRVPLQIVIQRQSSK